MAEGVYGVFTQPFVTNFILPFLLVFVLVYAILEKTNLLGEGKRYANLIIAFIIGILFIGAQVFVGFTIRFIPLIAVFLVILLCYFLIFGFIGIHETKGLKITLGIIFGIALVVGILWATGLLSKLVSSTPMADIIGWATLIVILGATIALTLSGAKKKTQGA